MREQLLAVYLAAGDYARRASARRRPRSSRRSRRGSRSSASRTRRSRRCERPRGSIRPTPSLATQLARAFVARGDLRRGRRVSDGRDRRRRSAAAADGGRDSAARRRAGRGRWRSLQPAARGGRVAPRQDVALLGWTVAEQVPDAGFRGRARRRRRRRASGLAGGGGGAAGIRHPRAESHPGADAPGRDLRRRRPRGDDVQRAGAAGRRLHRRRRRRRSAIHRRGSGRARAVGAREHRALPPRAGAAWASRIPMPSSPSD